jgi:hypothetical protein
MTLFANIFRHHTRLKIIRTAGMMMAVLLLFFSAAHAQFGNYDKYVYVIGQINNDFNGAPVTNHLVTLRSDSTFNPQFEYYRSIYTDENGFFSDTITTVCTKGGLIVSTVDFLSLTYDTTLYFRFDWEEFNTIEANFIIRDSLSNTSWQANFSFEKDTLESNYLRYYFYENSGAPEVFSWYWDFDDGTISTLQNPVHTFPEDGTYKVSLTIKGQSQTGTVYVSTIAKRVKVTKNNYYHMGGQVFGGYWPIDVGIAYLYKIENNEIYPVDTTSFDYSGIYYFFQLIEGMYLISVDLGPSSTILNKYFLTYYGDQLIWEKADTIFHHQTLWTYDIHLLPVPLPSMGPGKIAGTIQYGIPGKHIINPAADDVEILLLDGNENPLACYHSDEQGFFEFSDLPLNNYKVLAEVTGKINYSLDVTLDVAHPEVTNIHFTINTGDVSGYIDAIGEHLADNAYFRVFPVPADDRLYLEADMDTPEMYPSILDAQGSVVKQFDPCRLSGNALLPLSVAELPSGLYLLRIASSDGTIVLKKFIKD